MITIAVLTSSRADYGIYLPLLRAIEADEQLSLKLIVFGTHLSKNHGYTISQIIDDGFTPDYQIDSLLLSDTPNAISSSYALTAVKFAEFYQQTKDQIDLFICLGDRYEMAAAVAASIPYQLTFAHIHGGETTLGAIDNIYRHSISLASTLHFVSAEPFAERLRDILATENQNIYNVGSLSLENLSKIALLTLEQFHQKWGIDLKIPSILVTIHPETIALDQNENYAKQSCEAILKIATKYQVIITLPNADTDGLIYRNAFEKIAKIDSNIKLIENFGTQSYFSCMQHVKLLLGNTSSGIIEAATFKKYVINLGNRQAGRLCSGNVIHVPFQTDQIINATNQYIDKEFNEPNIYFKNDVAKNIVHQIKAFYGIDK